MKKFSVKYSIYQVIVSAIGLIFLAFTIWTGFADESGYIPPQYDLYVIVGYFICLAIASIYSYLYYQSSGYEFNEKEIICQRGVIFKKKSIVEYSKVHAVNIKQTLIERFLKISSLMIDSGSTNTAHTAEIIIHDNEDIIQELYNRLQNKEKNVVEEKEVDNLYSFTSSRKIIYTLLNSFIALIWLVIGTVFVAGILYWLEPMVDDEKITLLECVLYPLSLFGFMFICVALGNLCKVFISYYGFEIKKSNEIIEINYGLFSKIHNTFAVNRVKAVKISQGLIQRLFGFVTMRLEVVGYSETNNGEAIIGIFIPLCKTTEVNGYLEKILPNYIPEAKAESCKSFGALVLWGLFFAGLASIVVVIPLLVFSIGLNNYLIILIGGIGIIAWLVIFSSIYLINAGFGYFNQGISINDDKLTIYSGGITKHITIILKKDLIAIEDITTKWRSRKDIYSYKIHFHTNAGSNVVYVRALNQSLKDKLLALLKY